MSRSLQEKGVYGTWMFEEQDRIQAFARSFGERIVGEAFEEVLASDEVVGSGNEEILGKLFHLHLLASLERDLPWFMENGLLTPQEAEEVSLTALIILFLEEVYSDMEIVIKKPLNLIPFRQHTGTS